MNLALLSKAYTPQKGSLIQIATTNGVLNQVLLFGQNVLDFAWRLEPATLRTAGKHFTTAIS